MALEVFANQPQTIVSSGGTTAPAAGTQETWTVASSASFPAASHSAAPPTQFHVADIAAVTEIITVTNVSGTTWTVTRGAEGTTPLAHAAGFTVYQVVTAGALTGMLQAANSPAQVTYAQFASQATSVIAHRGLGQVAPEDTITAFASAIAAMRAAGYVPAIKVDTYALADESYGVMHDSTVDRTTTSTGQVSNYTAAAWQTLQCPAGTLTGPAWGNVPVPLLTDVFSQLGGQCVIFIESKTGSTGVAGILALVTAYGLQSSCALTAEDTGLTQPARALAAGVPFWYYWNVNAIASAPTPATVAATPGVSGLAIAIDPFSNGPNYTDSDVATVVAAAQGAGLGTQGFSYYHRIAYTRAAAAGITSHAVNDLYTLTSAAQRTADAFALGSPVPGEIGSETASSTQGITTFPTAAYTGGTGNWRRQFGPAHEGGGLYECMGFLGPAANLATFYTVAATVFWDATETGNSLGDRFAGIVVGCPDDRTYTGTGGSVNGYGCAIRQGNGSSFAAPTFQIFKNVLGAYQNNGTYANGTSTQLGSNETNATGYAAPNTLGASYANGATITSLTLGTAVTIPSGMKIALPNGQIAQVSGAVIASTAVTISSLTLTAALTSGQPVSFGIPVTVKVDYSTPGQVTITFKRNDTGDTRTVTDSTSPIIGGYFHIGKSGTGTGSSTLAISYAGITVS